MQEFKPFPEGIRPMPVDPFALPIEVRNLLEHGNIEGRPEQRSQDSDEQQQQQQAKPFPGPEDQGEEAERKFPIPADVRNFIHQVCSDSSQADYINFYTELILICHSFSIRFISM